MDTDVFSVLRAYPQIYLACHIEHRTRRSSETGLTSRDATFLAHIEKGGTSPSRLAHHLGIARSTLSASLTRLASQGYLTLSPVLTDARRRRVDLTDQGKRALVQASVLDEGHVVRLLNSMSSKDREDAVRGLELMANAAKMMRGKAP